MAAKIIDCFPYNGDLMALFRLQYLWEVVDEFVITEARETHSGQQKPALFLDTLSSAFEPYKSKIKPLIIDRFPTPDTETLERLRSPTIDTDPAAWFREKYQRNYAQDYLRAKTEPFVALVCDADEIPSHGAIATLRKNHANLDDCCKLEMLLFYYSTKWIKPGKWYHPFAVNEHGLKTATLDEMRLRFTKQRSLQNAGWHFSYFMTDADIERKLRSFAHTEYSSVQYRGREWIDHCRRTGTDLYQRGVKEDCLAYNGQDLPPSIFAFEREHGIQITES